MPSKNIHQHAFAAMSSTPEGRAKLKASGKKPMPTNVANEYMQADKGRHFSKAKKHG